MKLIKVSNQQELNAAIQQYNGALTIIVEQWNDEDLIIAGDVAGSVQISGDVAGFVDISGNVVGSVYIAGNVERSVYISGNVEHSVEISGNAQVGSVQISGDVEGHVYIAGNVERSVEICGDVAVRVEITGNSKVGSVEIYGNISGYKVNTSAKEKELLFKIKEIILNSPELLDMGSWHCGTTHCLGGHAIMLDERGQEIEAAQGSEIASTILLPSSIKYFHKSKEEVLKYLNEIN